MSSAVNLKDRTCFLGEILKESGQDVNLCYQCGKCTAGCPVAEEMDLGPRKVMHAVRLGLKNMVLDSDTIWYCASCETCSTRCPQDIEIAKIMDAARILAGREGRRSKLPEVPAFHKSFLESVRMFGRVYELGMIGMLKLRTFKFMQDAGLGIRMFLKGKLKLMPGFSGSAGTRRICSKVREMERSD